MWGTPNYVTTEEQLVFAFSGLILRYVGEL